MRERRRARFEDAVAQERYDARAGAAWGAVAGLFVAGTVAYGANLPLAVMLSLGIALGAVAGFVSGPKLAMLVLGSYVPDDDDDE